MAYNFIPEKIADIMKQPGLQNAKKERAEIVVLFQYLRHHFSDITTPIAIDPSTPKKIKITRRITSVKPVGAMKSEAQLKLLTLSPGEGSRGGRGAANRGNAFEQQLEHDIMAWVQGEVITNPAYETFIKEFVKHYKITVLDEVKIIPEGALNQRRPLQVNGDSVLIGNFPDFDIGKIVTDLTVKVPKGKARYRGPDGRTIYLSLKYGPTVSFFNAGIGKHFKNDDFQKLKCSQDTGKAILKLFGLDEENFFRSFLTAKKDRPKMHTVDVTNKVNRGRLIAFMKSGIGWGYHLAHFLNNKIEHNEMTNIFLESASKPESVIVNYGGATGDGKRVDILVETPKYRFKLNFRNKQGTGSLPTHIMSDYKAKH